MWSRKRGGLVVALMLGVVGLVVVLVIFDLRQDRQTLVRSFLRERVAATERIASDLSTRLSSIRRDLRYFQHLVERGAALSSASSTRGELARLGAELRALVEVAPHYRLVVLTRDDGERIVGARDPRWVVPPWLSAALDARIRALPRQPLVTVSLWPVLRPPGRASGGKELRLASTSIRLPSRRSGALLLVFEESYLTKPLHSFLAGDRPDLFLVDSVSGRPILLSDDRQADRARMVARSLRGLPFRRSGRLGPDYPEAFPGEVVTFAALAPTGKWRWHLVVAGSTSHLEAQQQENLVRAVAAIAAVALAIGALGWIVLVRVRREAELRERLNAAKEITYLHEMAKRILDNVPSGIFTIDGENRIVETNRILRSWNPGIEPEADLTSAFPGAAPQTLGRIVEMVAGARARAEPDREVFDHVPLMGEHPGTYVVRVVPLEVAGVSDVVAMIVIQDLSELRRLEENLLHSEKLATIGTVAAGIAHEIGTPLGVIRARAEHSLEKAADESNRRSLTKIIEQCDSISRIIQEVLGLAQRRDILLMAVSLDGVLDEVVELLTDRFDERRVELVRSVPPDLPTLQADADGLRRVLLNLLRNACQACSPGGRVEIRAEAPDGGPESGVLIRIVDDGRGIAPAVLGRIFDPFFTTKERGEGTGLGLAIARDIVRQHGGSITVDSVPGRGTVFTIGWPATEGGGHAFRREYA